ncbi:unnamed protein product, partial [Ectocarpus sp. 13 AM-2016]
TRSRSSAADSQGEAGAGSTGAKESDSWEEFRHPQFRRGRRDLLVGIKRQKDGGRLKRKRADSQKSDILTTLRADVDTLSEDLREANGKLDTIVSILMGATSGNHPQQGGGPSHSNLLMHLQNGGNSGGG